MRYRVAAVSAAVGVALTGALALASANVAVAKAAHPNMVIEWNQTMITAFTTASVAPPVATRQGGIFQSAVFDAVNGIDPKYTAIHVQPAAPDGASGQAAAASAAYTILLALYPSQKTSLLDGALASSIASMQDEEDARSIAARHRWIQRAAALVVVGHHARHLAADAGPRLLWRAQVPDPGYHDAVCAGLTVAISTRRTACPDQRSLRRGLHRGQGVGKSDEHRPDAMADGNRQVLAG